jgi:hypothetical protein
MVRSDQPDAIAADAEHLVASLDTRHKINEYLLSLPAWPTPKKAELVAGKPTVVDGDHDGKAMSCTTTPYDLTTNPQQIVMFQPDIATLWPGALIQGQGYLSGVGSLRELPIKKRAPLSLSISLPSKTNTKIVSQPAASSVQSAISELLQPLEGAQLDFGSSISFDMKETYQLDQAMLSLGLSAHYAGAEFSAKHDQQTSKESNVVTAVFIQNCFTAYIDNPVTPADFFSSDFTLADLQEQIAQGRIGKDNIPVYLSSVTYGRILYVTISSTKSMSEIKNAMKASYNSGTGGGGGDISAENKQILQEAELAISGIGIEMANAKDLIASGKIQSFFSKDMDIRSVKPISFMFYNMRDLSIAALADSAHYEITQCVPKVAAQPTPATAKHASDAENALNSYRDFVGAAASNAYDPGTRWQRITQYRASHAQFIQNLDWMRTGAKSLSLDDKVWLRGWVPPVLKEIEDQSSRWQLGYNTNPSDAGTQAVYADALNYTAAQRTMINAVTNALSS